jgi:hypothetical protein
MLRNAKNRVQKTIIVSCTNTQHVDDLWWVYVCQTATNRLFSTAHAQLNDTYVYTLVFIMYADCVFCEERTGLKINDLGISPFTSQVQETRHVQFTTDVQKMRHLTVYDLILFHTKKKLNKRVLFKNNKTTDNVMVVITKRTRQKRCVVRKFSNFSQFLRIQVDLYKPAYPCWRHYIRMLLVQYS